MYLEIKSDDPQPIAEASDEARHSRRPRPSLYGRAGESLLVEASINETDEPSTS
jgi:hypothetical protein